MTLARFLPLCAVLALAAGLAGVQPAIPLDAAAAIAKYDKNHDKTLDLPEVEAAAAARFDRFDKRFRRPG